jgi:NAD(P)-dependent dehydrogenase (short-subunit alcohol dehydrogenase family)
VFKTELQVRLVGAVAMVQSFLPLLRSGAGRLIWVVTPGLIPTPYVGSIHVCDFAVNCLARTLELELKPWRIPVVQIRCGGIKTAKGLETTAEVEKLLGRRGAELYRDRLTRWKEDMAEFDTKRTEPEVVARTIWQALTAAHPRRQYQVGHMVRVVGLLESLPQTLTDSILAMRF